MGDPVLAAFIGQVLFRRPTIWLCIICGAWRCLNPAGPCVFCKHEIWLCLEEDG